MRAVGWWVAHFNVLAICGVLAGAFVVQFGEGEVPCPLCILQRMAMMLCALGPAYVILQGRDGQVSATGFATGYGLSVVAAACGACISARQVLLHIVPPDPGFGSPVFGLHLYTWALVVFGVVLLMSGLNVIFIREMLPDPQVTVGWVSQGVICLFAVIIVANMVVVFCQEGLHWTLPDDPTRYELFYDLTSSS